MPQADFEIFCTTLAAVPRGRFTSYGQIARLCGVHVRQVQAWLRKLPRDTSLPWFRIINSQNRITEHSGSTEQHRCLMEDGLLPLANGRYPAELFWAGE